MNKWVKIAICVSLFGGTVVTASETNPQVWVYKDWQVLVETVAGEQDTMITCTAVSQNGGPLDVEVTQFNLDAGPPYVFPTVSITPTLSDGKPMAVAPEDLGVEWVFDNVQTIRTNLTQETLSENPNHFVVTDSQSQEILVAMRKASTLVLHTSLFRNVEISLSGFTASYGKMADACDFSTEGVFKK